MTVGITVVFRDEDHERIDDLAYEDRMSKAEYIRRAVDEYVEEHTDENGITVQL